MRSIVGAPSRVASRMASLPSYVKLIAYHLGNGGGRTAQLHQFASDSCRGQCTVTKSAKLPCM